MPPNASVEVGGTLEVADLARYQYYHFLRRLWPVVILLVCAAVLIGPAAIYLIVTANADELRTRLANAVPFLLLIAFWLSLPIVVPRWAAKKQLKTQSYLREPVSYSFGRDGIEMNGQSVSSRMAWSTIREVRETKSLFLLYHAPNIAIVLPKRFFDGVDELERWRRLVAAAFSKGISSSLPVGRWC